ncbi:MAG TPA: insulinase family protein [Candidatus Caccoplasma intestinavium]|uniref:Insulinase family protein n=1 Tax=Candidatus Caccoplasma intestinavium TaxID=2840716 RepID=A0A9D1GED8_9BACT|nr:insulinase family protein [Candidatus Caccoplasma intestinavium]
MTVNKYQFLNGLRLLHHADSNTRMVAINLLYDVGARDESPDCTGFAHLFEHLMFGGSLHIPDFDTALQKAGGENNAWTSNDITNYYTIVPRQNVETAFWLESDRMLGLDFSQHSLDVQKAVVMEEFKQRTLNQPYGDIPAIIRELAYREHPYRWPVIGRDISHIEKATLEDVRSFFYNHYAPNNAILAVVGDISFEEALRLSEKWFSPIEKRNIAPRCILPEPEQEAPRYKEVVRDIPSDAIVKAYHMGRRCDADYQTCDLMSDILSNGRSSRLFRRLVMEKSLFTSIDASITGDIDAGLFLINGRLNQGVSLQQADEAIEEELGRLCRESASEQEISKMVHKFETGYLFSNLSYVDKAANLSYFELIDAAESIDREVEKYYRITPESLQKTAQAVFRANNMSTLYYKAQDSC